VFFVPGKAAERALLAAMVLTLREDAGARWEAQESAPERLPRGMLRLYAAAHVV
jgi:hypothetical protein